MPNTIIKFPNIPLQFLFSGTVFTKGERNFAVSPVPWDREGHYDLPVSVWRDLIALHYPHSGWIRLHHNTIDALADYKARHALLGLDDAESVAGFLAGWISPTGDIDAPDRFMDALDRLSAADLTDFAKKNLTRDQRTVVSLVPKQKGAEP